MTISDPKHITICFSQIAGENLTIMAYYMLNGSWDKAREALKSGKYLAIRLRKHTPKTGDINFSCPNQTLEPIFLQK
jgi:hypothetical protein